MRVIQRSQVPSLQMGKTEETLSLAGKLFEQWHLPLRSREMNDFFVVLRLAN